MANAPDIALMVTALTDAVKALTTAVSDQKTAFTTAVNDQKAALTQAVEKITQAVTSKPDPNPFKNKSDAQKAVDKFNDILAGLQLKYKPEAPISITAKPVSSNQIDLSWAESTNNNPDGFKLERGEGTSPVNFTEIKRFGLKETNYSDTGLTGKTTYVYRLRAFNLRGDSAPAEDSATTL